MGASERNSQIGPNSTIFLSSFPYPAQNVALANMSIDTIALRMGKHGRGLWASTLFSLMAISQVQSAAASPFPRRPYNGAVTVTDTDCPPTESSPPSPPQQINAIEYYSDVQPAVTTDSDEWVPPQGIAWQIEDGQVQAYSIATEGILVSDEGVPSTTATMISGYETYTPSPKGWNPPSGSDWKTESHSWKHHHTHGPWQGSRPDQWRHSTSTTPEPASTPAVPQTSTQEVSTEAAGISSPALQSLSTSTTAASSPVEPTPIPSFTTSVPDVSLTSLSNSEVQTVTAPPPSSTSGIIPTGLETSGNPADQPFPTLSVNASGSLSLVDTATLGSLGPTATANVTAISADNIFQVIATDAPPAHISSRSDHPVPLIGIQQQQRRLQTNKFYANLFLGDQTNAAWTHPYSVAWSGGGGQTDSYGMAISHIERDQIVGGPADSSDRAEWGFFAAPLGIQSIVLSAAELGAGTTMTTDTLEAFSINANLIAPGGSAPLITLPLVQGMAFVTAIYGRGTPLIQTGLGFENITYVGSIQDGTTFKYRIRLTGGRTWLMYVTPVKSDYSQNSFTLLSPVAIQGPSGFGGQIQVAKVPEIAADNAETLYDASAGTWASGATISGSVDGTAGAYTLSWTKEGSSNSKLLMFALPHHVESFGSATSGSITNLQLMTTTKGMATAVHADSWTLAEPELPITMGFNPWSPTQGDVKTLPQTAIEAINLAADAELRESVANQSSVGSMYYDGKALAKFAAIVYVLHELADNVTLALTGLQELESAFASHVDNLQTFPLVYDTQWGGAVSISTYLTGNNGDDFGNTYYNDHHFHFGYFVYAASVIGYLNPGWLSSGTNKSWVNMLVRDYANPIEDDPYFPFSRSFDWYNGHSWAKGLFPSADGKDQESSSEDTMASYALKMWGRISGDKNMEARGNLMLAIQARSLQNYYLYTDDNEVEPPQYIGNKVAGIMFDNKCDHTTYFGNNIEFIQGIHMLPLLPMSTLIRSKTFVQQEWDAYDLSTYTPTVQGGWQGVLMANLAIIDPRTSYNFFSNASGNFNLGMLDGGASQTWYLAWSAALGGSHQ